jgi:hypothetical protein
VVLKLDAGDPGTKTLVEGFEKKMLGTTKPMKKRDQNPAEQVCFSKLCKAGQQSAVVIFFCNTPL